MTNHGGRGKKVLARYGEVLYEGQLDDILQILPQPVRLQHNNVTLIVVDYSLWKRKVLQKQHNEGE